MSLLVRADALSPLGNTPWRSYTDAKAITSGSDTPIKRSIDDMTFDFWASLWELPLERQPIRYFWVEFVFREITGAEKLYIATF